MSQTYYVKCATKEERDSLLDYAVKRGAREIPMAQADAPWVYMSPDKHFLGVYSGSKQCGNATELTPDSFRRKVRKLWPSKPSRGIIDEPPRVHKPKQPKASPNVSEPSQLDRIEGMLTDLTKQVGLDSHNSIMSHLQVQMGFRKRMCEEHKEIISRLASLSQPTEEQAEPQPEGLRPGDYTDASKEVADALTAMGWEWWDDDRHKEKYIRFGQNSAKGKMININQMGATCHLTPAEFLSRAAVTAKEIGLVPVVEKWVPKVGDWVVVINAHSFDGWVNGDLFQVSQVEPDTDCYPDRSRYGSICYPFPPHRLRPATEAEIAAHLAEQEARARDEKVAKLKFGVHVAHLGRECVALQPAIMNRIDIAKLNAAGQHYFENVHIDDITVIEQP